MCGARTDRDTPQQDSSSSKDSLLFWLDYPSIEKSKGDARMKKTLFVFFCLILLSFFLFSGCKKAKREALASDKTGGMEASELKVLSVSPKGSTQAPHESETIVAIFSQPMVPLEALPEGKGSSFLKIEPATSGKHRWKGTKILAFTPDKRFPYATEIKVTIPAGVKSLDSSILKEDFIWSFKTIKPRVVKNIPGSSETWVRLEERILLFFNQSITSSKAKEFISLVEVGPSNEERAMSFSMVHPGEKFLKEEKLEASPREVLLIETKEKFKPDSTYYVEVREGLPGEEGPLRMEQSYIFNFETIKSFTFLELEITQPHNPYDPLEFRFSNSVKYSDFMKCVQFEPEVAIPDYYSEWTHSDSILYLTLPFKPEEEYSVKISAELADDFGNKLGKEVKRTFKTASYSPSVFMPTEHGIVEAYGNLQYPLTVLNAKEVLLQAAKVNINDVIPLLNEEKVFWSNEKFSSKKGFFGVEKTLTFPLTRNKKQTFPLKLEEFLPEKHGLLFLQLDTFLPDEWDRFPKAFLQVTEIGISAKFSAENNLIWVTELKTGLPLPEAEVEIRDDSNTIRWKGRTDRDGKVQTPGWRALGIESKETWQKPLQWVFARRGEDVAFTSSEWGTGVYPYLFGIEYDWNPQPERIKGYLFTERGIYRAGEEVHVKGILRKVEKGMLAIPSIKEVDCEILDPYSRSVFKDKISLDRFGSFTFDVPLSEEASLGRYQVKAESPPEEQRERSTFISCSFQVEAFRPAEFEVHLRTERENYVFGEEYRAEIRASYLFGGIMSGQKTTWFLRLNPTSFIPPGYKEYIFGNELDRWEWEEREESRLIASGEGELNSEGKYEVKTKLTPEKEKDSVQATFEATVEGPSRRSISNKIETVIHRGEFYIGLRPGTTLLEKGNELAVDVISVDEKGIMVAENQIELKLLKREWLSVRQKGIGGSFDWTTRKEDKEIASKRVISKGEVQRVVFLPEKSGFYILQAAGKDRKENEITTTTSFYVTGKDYVPWERRDDDSIELVPDKEKYQPGDRARILVKSPYERAKALVTVEREQIIQSHVVEIQGSAYSLDIPIIADYIPNVFVSVILVQGRVSEPAADGSEDIGKPSFKIGYAELKVDPSQKRLTVDIEKDKNAYKPRENVTIRLKVKDWQGKGTQASVCLAVVDLGVLNLIGYKIPDLFGNFYSSRMLSVGTSETRFYVVAQREYGQKGDEFGGGGEKYMKALGMSIAEVELRGDFKPTAYWNASIITDEKGEASVQFTLPDNLTTFQVMAFAQTRESQFGWEESSFKVAKPLLLQASLPRFARIRDSFKGGVVVHNYSSKKSEVTLYCESKGILLLDKKQTQEFTLDPGQSREVLFSFEAQKTGKARFAFRAQMGEESDGLEITLPIKLPRPTETVALFNQTDTSAEEKIVIPEEIFPSEGKIEVYSSASALSELKGSIDYLTDYPYLCLEQRLSSVLPYIIASDIILDFNLSKLEIKEIRNYVNKTLKEIYQYQQENGGFALWTDSAYDSPFITCFTAFALVKAQEAGYRVEMERLEQVKRYLKNFLRESRREGDYPYNEREWKTTQAFALYCLALLNAPEPSYAEKLFNERDGLSLFGQTLLLKALYHGGGAQNTIETLSDELMNKVKVTAGTAHFEDEAGKNWIYSSSLRTTALILQTMVEVGSRNPLLPSVAQWLVEKRSAGHWHSTQENFYVFYGLNTFYRVFEKVEPDFRVEIELAGKMLLKETFQRQRSKTAWAETSLDQFKQGKSLPLEIKKKGEGVLYYGARMTYAPSLKVNPREEGIAVSKKIESLDGKPLETVKAGSLVLVTLEIALPQEGLFVVVNDPLPAGFEAVNLEFLTESQEQQRKLEEQGQDRLKRWWEGFTHVEMHDDRVLLFADSLRAGIHTHRYLARALSYGEFQTPGTFAEEMYSPEVFGRSSEIVVKIVK